MKNSEPPWESSSRTTGSGARSLPGAGSGEGFAGTEVTYDECVRSWRQKDGLSLLVRSMVAAHVGAASAGDEGGAQAGYEALGTFGADSLRFVATGLVETLATAVSMLAEGLHRPPVEILRVLFELDDLAPAEALLEGLMDEV